MWVDNGNQFSVMSIELLLHAKRVREGMSVPCEVLLAVSVLDVKPDNVVRDAMPVHFLVNILDVLICNIVPSALVVCNGKLLRKLGISCKLTILRYYIFWRRTQKHKDIQKATF